VKILLITILVFVMTACSLPVRVRSQQDFKTMQYYTIRAGDTLYNIGVKSGHGYQKLAAWNAIRPPYHLSVGRQIRLFPTAKKQADIDWYEWQAPLEIRQSKKAILTKLPPLSRLYSAKIKHQALRELPKVKLLPEIKPKVQLDKVKAVPKIIQPKPKPKPKPKLSA